MTAKGRAVSEPMPRDSAAGMRSRMATPLEQDAAAFFFERAPGASLGYNKMDFLHVERRRNVS
jgi:hypothetical protein